MMAVSNRSRLLSLLCACVWMLVIGPGLVAAQRPRIVQTESPGSAFAERWTWAEREAERRGAPHWIGYSIIRPMDENVWITSGAINISGGQIQFRGIPLNQLLGRAAPVEDSRREVAILLHFPTAGSRVSDVDAVKRVSIDVPIELDEDVVFWLDRVSNEESVAFLSRAFDSAEPVRVREHLLEAIGTHDAPQLVLPFLQQVVLGHDVERLRAEAAEELGGQNTREATELLERVARTDRSSAVRQEAAEALGESTAPDATDVLIRLIRELDDVEVREEAVESLAERPRSATVVTALMRIAFEDPHTRVQAEAIDALAEGGYVDELIRVARTHPDRALRREAIEALGDSDDPRAREELLRILEGR